MVYSIRSLLLLGVMGFLPYVRDICADEPQRRAPEAALFYGAVAFEGALSSHPVLKLTNTETLTEVRLDQISARIEEIAKRQVVIDYGALTDLKIDFDHRVTWSQGETIEQLLTRIHNPDQHELIWQIDERILRLTTDEKSGEWYTTQRYFVGDLLTEEFPVDKIMRVIENETSGPWHNDEPGTGTITPLGNHLYVRQTHRVQSEIVGVLQALRSDRPIVLMYMSEEQLRLLRALEVQTVSFDWPEITLEEFFRRLEEMTQIPFHVDKQGLQREGLDSDSLIAARARDLPLRRALEICLEGVNGVPLTWYLDDEDKIGITVPGCYEQRFTMVLNLTSLGITGDRLEQFAELVQNETRGPWDRDEPGGGTLSIIPGRNALIINQTRTCQREILQILADLRTLPKDQPLFSPASTMPVTRYYNLAAETAKALVTLIPETIAPGTWESVPPADDKPPAQAKPAAEDGTTPAKQPQPGRLIVIPIPVQKQTIEVLSEINSQFGGGAPKVPETNPTGTPGTDSYLAITHTPEVHAQVEKFLKKLHQIPEVVPASGFPGGGGGFFRLPLDR